MSRKKKIAAAIVLSGSIGLGAHPLFAQTGSGGSAPGMGGTGQPGSTAPQPGPTAPRETLPTIPAQPAPRAPGQTEQVPPGQQGMPRSSAPAGQGVPGESRIPGIAGQTDQIVPGQQGTIPERVEGPRGSQERGSLTASADDVKKAKEALKAQGHNPGTIDGNMDDRTQQALRDFQQANKLPVTGMLDPQTAAKLGLTLKSGSSTPQRGRDGVSPQGDKSPIPGQRAVE